MLWKKTVYNGDAGRAACQCGLVHVLLLAGDSGGGTEGDSVRVERMDLGKEAFLLWNTAGRVGHIKGAELVLWVKLV